MMTLCVYTPGGRPPAMEVRSLVFQGEKGETCVLPGHTAAVFGLYAGPVRVKTPEGETLRFTADDGFVRVQKDAIEVFCGAWAPAAQ